MKDISKFITTSDAITVARVSRATVRNWCRDRNLGVKIGGRWKIDPKRLDDLMSGYSGYFQEEKNGQRKKAKSRKG